MGMSRRGFKRGMAKLMSRGHSKTSAYTRMSKLSSGSSRGMRSDRSRARTAKSVDSFGQQKTHSTNPSRYKYLSTTEGGDRVYWDNKLQQYHHVEE